MCDRFRKIHRCDSSQRATQTLTNDLFKKDSNHYQPIIHQLMESASLMEVAMAQLLQVQSKKMELTIDNLFASSNISKNDLFDMSEILAILENIKLLITTGQLESGVSDILQSETDRIEFIVQSLEEKILPVSLDELKESTKDLKEILLAIVNIEDDILKKFQTALAITRL